MVILVGDWNLQELKIGPSKKRAVEFAGLENDGLESDGVEQEQKYILHLMKKFNVYDM